ncbi:MAG: ATP-binding protein, partial [Deltaproteobacteria bacterium]
LVFRDATEERAAKDAVSYRASLLESVDDAVVATGLDDLVRSWNQGAVRMYGWREDEAIGQDPHRLLGMEYAGTTREDFRKLLATTGTRGVAVRCLNKSGQVVHAEISAAAMTREGRITGYVTAHRDTTEARSMQARLSVSERMASLGTLAAGVAHEINNPLSYTLANTELASSIVASLLATLPPGAAGHDQLAEALDALTEAHEGNQRMSAIVRDLRIFSRGDDATAGRVDVRGPLETSIKLTSNEIRHRARLVRDLRPVPMVDASESRLGQVFLNLLVNAAQSIPEGSVVSNEVRVATRVAGDGRVLVEVSDTGGGMTPEVQARIFDPFFTTKAVGAGTGLGLSICSGIVKALGGEILVESTPGKGSTFSVLLPAASAPATMISPRRSAPLGRAGRILIVDDDPAVARVLKRMLGSNHETTVMTEARQALDCVASGKRFDLILCDLMMPAMTGQELHAALVRVAPEQAEHMVFITGGAFTPEARAFLAGRPGGWVDKPFDPEALRTIVFSRLGPADAPASLAHPSEPSHTR